VRSLGDRAGLSEITFQADVLRGGSYTVLSQVHDYEVDGGSLTASELRAAGVDYPSWIGPYVQVNEGASGPRTASKAGEIARRAASLGLDNPYDKARLLQDGLRDLGYATSVEGLCRVGENVPECLLRSESGFCQHYATTMVMVLRELEIPARLVNGYLPGLQVDADRYEVPMQALHAWTEVYFPGIGWVRFDPTPGGQLGQYQQQPTRFEEGEASAFPLPSGAPLPDEADASAGPVESPSPSPSAAVALPGDGGLGGGELVAAILVGGGLALLLLAASIGILYAWLRRLPGSDGGLAYTRIISLASRLGYGPHPAQTEYEYAASLSTTLPSVREELYAVARAHVEQRYGRRGVAAGQLPALRRAYARIRSALLRLGLRART
jgi:transglutaminase-like putative cysteine protease